MMRKRRGNPSFVTLVAGALALSSAAVAATHEGKTPPPTPAPAAAAAPATPVLTASDVEAFLTGLVPAQLGREDIAGAVVMVVKDGQVLFGRGYGFADVEKRTPVSTDTLFRPGSVSKLFTWTAVMQQVEQGKLDLDADVNKYIDFKIPETFGKPITLRDIMTHTPGFEEAVRDLFVADAAHQVPLGTYLSTHLPQRIFAPGTTGAYSNYATALAGYIVERVSGVKFADYIEQFVTGPLGMTHSTFRQPLPAALEPLMSKGYKLGSGKPQPFEFVNPAPAGALSASGADMARFVIAHLQDGRLGDGQILKPETARLMYARQRGHSPDMNAMCLGFYEESRNGHRIISHGGDTQWFHSDLHLVLDAGVGFFVSYNSAGKGEVSGRSDLWHAFLDRYFPYTPSAAQRAANAQAEVKAVVGPYLISRRSESNFLRLLNLLSETTVSASEGDTIEVDALKGPNGKALRWEPIGGGKFRQVNGQEIIVFLPGEGGRTELVTSYPFFAFVRPPTLLSRSLLLPVSIGSLVILLLTVILWPIGAIIRRHYRKRLELPPGEKRLRLWTRIACLLDVAAVGAFGGILVVGLQNITLFSARMDPWLRLLQALALLAIVGGVVALWNALRAWGSQSRGVWSKLGETLIALACVAFVALILIGRVLHVGGVY
jgi:CubicO group peptidase (beta-lactamase class C family)